MRKTGLLILGFSLFWQIHSAFALDQNQKQMQSLNLNLPAGVRINIFAGNVPRARHMAFDDQGVLFLSQAKAGKVVALPDNDKNGEADKTIPILEDRDMAARSGFFSTQTLQEEPTDKYSLLSFIFRVRVKCPPPGIPSMMVSGFP